MRCFFFAFSLVFVCFFSFLWNAVYNHSKQYLNVYVVGKQNISASWNNVTVTKPVFVNASATSPDVVTIVFHSAHALVDPKHPSDTSGGGTSFIQSAVTVLIISGTLSCLNYSVLNELFKSLLFQWKQYKWTLSFTLKSCLRLRKFLRAGKNRQS